MVTLQTRVRPRESVLFRDLAGEAVLLELDSGTYFGLDEVGTSFWNELVSRESLDAAVGALQQEYDVASETLRKDLCEFVEVLLARGLLQIHAP